MATSGSGTSTPITGVGGSYTLAQLVSRWRQRLDDTEAPYLWSDDEITEYCDTLQKMLVAEIPILDDREETSICDVALVQGDGLVELSPRITRIVRARLDGEDRFLDIVDAEYMSDNYPDWDDPSYTQDTPTMLIVKGVGPNKAYLWPPLDAVTGTLKLQVYREPLLDLVYSQHSTEFLEIDQYAHLLVHGIMWQAYLKQDSDVYDPRRAEQHRIYWEGENGHGGDKERIRRMVLRRHQYPSVVAPMKAFS